MPVRLSSLKTAWLAGFFFALPALIIHLQSPAPPASGDDQNHLLFYASFDKNFLADEAAGDESPLGNQDLKIVREGKRGGAAYLDTGSILTYDAPGNLYAERGAICFWWKLDEPLGRTPFSIIRISYARHSASDFTFAQLYWTGGDLRLWVRDRDSLIHEVPAVPSSDLVSGRWFHLAFTWDELDGIRLYIEGREVGHKLGELHLAANLDQVGIHGNTVTPYYNSGTERKVFIDELRFYDNAISPTAIYDLTQRGGGRAGSMPPPASVNPQLWNQHWMKRFGWEEKNSIPRITSPAWIRKVGVLNGKDLKKSSVKILDGIRETYWPEAADGYSEGGKALDLAVENESFNSIQMRGNFRGRLYQFKRTQKALLFDRSRVTGEATHLRMNVPLTTSRLRIEREQGVLSELSLFSIGPVPSTQIGEGKVASAPAGTVALSESRNTGADGSGKIAAPDRISYRLLPSPEAANLAGVSRSQISSLYNLGTKLSRRYLLKDRESWVGVPAEIYKPSETNVKSLEANHYCHVILPPLLQHTALDAVKLKLNPEGKNSPGETVVSIVLRDPVAPLRDLINLNLRLPAGAAEMVLDFRDVVVPAGVALWLTLASDQVDFGQRCLTGAEVELWLSKTGDSERAERSRKEYLSDRLLWIKDSFQMLSRARPWTMPDISKLRRQFRLVDELLALIEDVLRVEPRDPAATAYLGWVKADASPPDFKQPESTDAEVPKWAYQQQVLLRQFRQIVDWWIENRQIGTGELGGGLAGDTDLVSNWPGIALMEGSGRTGIRDSFRAVLEACYRRGMIEQGLNTTRADPLHAYEQGIGIVALASLLDYGGPLVIERLMETARQYDRLTEINPAGHRHFRSYLFSATDLVEEGYYAREDIFSALLWHSGLYLAWYNGNPQVIRQLSEYANALLAHWQRDRYPNLTQGIRFSSDEVVRRDLPNPEVVNVMWGTYRLAGNEKYLWLVDKLVRGGNTDRAEMTGGRWLEYVDPEPYHTAILEEVHQRKIWDHNLRYDESGLIARQYAYELSGDKGQVEDYQAALIKHMTQNVYLYTEAEPFTGSIRIPQRATQRARLGGVAHHLGYFFPENAISWESADGNVATLVRRATLNSLKVIAYNLAKSVQDVGMRVWELENGSYQVVEGTDVNGDDEIDVVTTKRTLSLKRRVAIPLALRPRKVTIIEIRQLQKGTPLWELPDLAIGREDLQYDAATDQGKLIIHNIGGKKSSSFTLVVENEKKAVLLRKEIDGLEAPVDLKPKTVSIELSGLRTRGARTLVLKIDPENKVEEITEENNQLRMQIE
jgi:Concanavalin A-like lectin/glucanases superfamily